MHKQHFLRFDSRGRITIPNGLRRGLGKEFLAIRTSDGIELYDVGVAKPLKILASAKDLSGESAALEEA
ncbi:MAG: division/cell wall cluster transcriptional repressor MraZ [Halobacteriales archaeon]|nr:division/cell wall cluster transcriptional repressor MraZ [Halobacteriales archaeon]